MSYKILYSDDLNIKIYVQEDVSLLQSIFQLTNKTYSDCGEYKHKKIIIGYDLVLDIKYKNDITALFKQRDKLIKQLQKRKEKMIKQQKQKTKKIMEKSLNIKKEKKN